MITRQQILEISEPFEEMYSGITNQILIMMAEYIGKDIDEPIEVWQQKRIQEINLLFPPMLISLINIKGAYCIMLLLYFLMMIIFILIFNCIIY